MAVAQSQWMMVAAAQLTALYLNKSDVQDQ
jgi:hypothetical protein